MIGDAAATGAITPRFASASSVRSAPVTVSPERAAEVTAKRDHVTARAEAHFEKHRQGWTNQQYGKLLAVDGERMALRPRGMPDDRKAHLMRAADHMVRQKQAQRLTRIDRVADKMLSGNRVQTHDRQRGR